MVLVFTVKQYYTLKIRVQDRMAGYYKMTRKTSFVKEFKDTAFSLKKVKFLNL